jgi:CheY-like chemotaxis protein
MSILIVDDDRAIREMLLENLADEGYPAFAVGDGLEALEYLRNGQSPCLILLDLMMPRMDGWQFVRAQLGTPAIASIPVLVLSARPDGREQAAELAVAGYLSKPVHFDQLFAAVGRFCLKA